jgi:hypothetical protein
MSQLYVKITNVNGENGCETLESYCKRLSKKNNSILYKLENYLQKSMLSEPELLEIRDVILTVSGDISRIPINIIYGDPHEKL